MPDDDWDGSRLPWAGSYLDTAGVDRERQAYYLGDRAVWGGIPVREIPTLMRYRGWLVWGTDSIATTLWLMRTGSVPERRVGSWR